MGSFCPMFGQTLFARLATERFVRQTRCWTRMFDRLAGALLESSHAIGKKHNNNNNV